MAYRTGLQSFVDAGFDARQPATRRSRGIDRAPTELLEEAASKESACRCTIGQRGLEQVVRQRSTPPGWTKHR